MSDLRVLFRYSVLVLAAVWVCACAAEAPIGVEADTLPTLALLEDVRIGSVGDAEAGFSRIGAVDVAEDGRVLVLETQERRVRVYNDRGQLILAIGRPGDGPGEFRGPSWLGVRGDTLWVGDMGNARLTLFRLDGALLTTVPVRPVPLNLSGVNGSIIPNAPIGNGRFDSRIRLLSEGRTGWDSVRVPALEFDSTGAAIDTVGSVFIAGSPPRQVVVQFPHTALMPEPLHDWLIVTPVAGDSVRISRTSPESAEPHVFTVTKTNAAGDTVYHTRVQYRPKPVDHDTILAAALRRNAGVPLPRAAVERTLRTGLPTQRYYPPVARHRIGADGSVWLQREDVGGDTVSWLIIGPTGTPLGHVRLARDHRLMWVSAKSVWIVEPDAWDVPWLVRRRAEPRPR